MEEHRGRHFTLHAEATFSQRNGQGSLIHYLPWPLISQMELIRADLFHQRDMNRPGYSRDLPR